MNKQDALNNSIKLITQNREKDYGSTHSNFGRIARLWSVIFEPILKPGAVVAPYQVALAMDGLKTARLIETPDHMDSWFDKGGYVGIGCELATEEPMPEWERDLLRPHVGEVLHGAGQFESLPIGSEVSYNGTGHDRYHWTKAGDGMWHDSDTSQIAYDPRTNAQMATEHGRTLLKIGDGQ